MAGVAPGVHWGRPAPLYPHLPAGEAPLWSDDHLCALGSLDTGDAHLEWLDAPGGAGCSFDLPSLSELEGWRGSPPPGPVPPPPPLRCLDPAHTAACNMCCAAPSAERHGQFELTGHGGTKVLRALLVGSTEWSSAHAREQLASQLEVEADQSGVVDVLRRKCARDLKKVHMLVLCHRWGYKSNIWQQKGAAKALARSAPAQSQSAAPASHQQMQHASADVLGRGHRRLPAIIDGHSVALFVDSTLAAFTRRSAALLSGPAAAELAATQREGFFTRESLAEYSRMAAVCCALSASWGAAARSHRAWASTLLCTARRSDTDPSCAWQVLALSKEEQLDDVLGQLERILSTAERARHISSDREQTEAFQLVTKEFREAFHQGLALVHSARLLMCQLRASATFCDYAGAGEQLLLVSKSYAEAGSEAFNRRCEWSAAALRSGIRLAGMPSELTTRYYDEMNAMTTLAVAPALTAGQ